jgi:hypothetical protein
LLESLIELKPWRLDCQQQIETSFPMTLMRTTTMRWRTTSPSTLHVHHHDGGTTMTSRCTKSFHILRIDKIGKVWEVTLIVALSIAHSR